jgi:glycosyltransferase involved in cell wall biosynthesis
MYFAEYKPKAHIAWRHNIKLTDAPTYLWCHDLTAAGVENHKTFEKVFALSHFHKDFLHTICGVPLDKIWVTANGINPDRFAVKLNEKEPGRVIFSSSPDRGLDRAIKVMDKVHAVYANATLHCYYGFDNMLKMNKHDEVNNLKKMIAERPWVTFHGNLEQGELTKEFQKSEVWLYPTNFLETYCITAIEALCCGVYPVVRSWGALPDTLAAAVTNRMATVIDSDCQTEEEIQKYAGAVLDALYTKKHTVVEVNPQIYSWERVAKAWIEFIGL